MNIYENTYYQNSLFLAVISISYFITGGEVAAAGEAPIYGGVPVTPVHFCLIFSYTNFTRKMFKKVFLSIFAFFILVSFTILVSPSVRQLMLSAGIIQEKVLIAGTGSMYPTFPKGEGETDVVVAKEIVAWPRMRRFPSGVNIFGTSLFSYKIKHGDIVEFENEKTKTISREKYGDEAGFVKRVIAVPRDKIEFRDGFVVLNGRIIDEPYTAKPRSTYGGDFLADCQVFEVPQGSVFVLGDNRKASLDSRYSLGIVDFSSIHYVIPWEEQEEYKKLWRDTKEDALLAFTPTLDPLQFLRLLNEKRKEQNLTPYKYNSLLSNSAKLRGQVMIKYNDFSTEATRSGITLRRALREAGYQNIIFAEVFTRGFYEAEELIDNFLEFPETKKILYSTEYQDIGLAAVLGETEGCPIQVVVVHFGGYVPPNYRKEETDSWQNLINKLEEVLPSWRSLKTAEGVDQNKLDKLLSILELRLNNAKRIHARMRANQWLTEEERKLAEEDKKLAQEAEEIISLFPGR